jgi:hypothetical protein
MTSIINSVMNDQVQNCIKSKHIIKKHLIKETKISRKKRRKLSMWQKIVFKRKMNNLQIHRKLHWKQLNNNLNHPKYN